MPGGAPRYCRRGAAGTVGVDDDLGKADGFMIPPDGEACNAFASYTVRTAPVSVTMR
jgi:hypothetical protein